MQGCQMKVSYEQQILPLSSGHNGRTLTLHCYCFLRNQKTLEIPTHVMINVYGQSHSKLAAWNSAWLRPKCWSTKQGICGICDPRISNPNINSKSTKVGDGRGASSLLRASAFFSGTRLYLLSSPTLHSIYKFSTRFLHQKCNGGTTCGIIENNNDQ